MAYERSSSEVSGETEIGKYRYINIKKDKEIKDSAYVRLWDKRRKQILL